MNCAIFVTKRAYSRSGPCAYKRGIKSVKDKNGNTVKACRQHRKMIESGKLLLIANRAK